MVAQERARAPSLYDCEGRARMQGAGRVDDNGGCAGLPTRAAFLQAMAPARRSASFAPRLPTECESDCISIDALRRRSEFIHSRSPNHMRPTGAKVDVGRNAGDVKPLPTERCLSVAPGTMQNMVWRDLALDGDCNKRHGPNLVAHVPRFQGDRLGFVILHESLL